MPSAYVAPAYTAGGNSGTLSRRNVCCATWSSFQMRAVAEATFLNRFAAVGRLGPPRRAMRRCAWSAGGANAPAGTGRRSPAAPHQPRGARPPWEPAGCGGRQIAPVASRMPPGFRHTAWHTTACGPALGTWPAWHPTHSSSDGANTVARPRSAAVRPAPPRCRGGHPPSYSARAVARGRADERQQRRLALLKPGPHV